MSTVLAADLGGTKCRFAAVSAAHGVVAAQRVATVRELEPFLRAMDGAITAVLRALPGGMPPPVAIGVGTAGVVPPGDRVVAQAPNLPLDGFPLADHLEARFGLPATVLNDGRASALGEHLRGAARGADPLLCLFFGTGIGVGLIVGQRPYRGADNAAGEIGHLVWRPGGRTCACGRPGHYEAYCGGRAITEQAAAELGPPPRGGAWSVDDVVAEGSPAARRILAEAEAAATALVANACTLLNPRAVVLGGGVLAGWPALRARIEAFVREQCTPSIAAGLRFCASMSGSDAILWGAAAATGRLDTAVADGAAG